MTPPRDFIAYVLYTDGGSRGNPGPAGAGLAINDPAGRCVYEAGLFLGRATNNVAEYAGLVAGLKVALEQGYRPLLVRSDSELMVRQLTGRYRVKNAGLKPYYEQARGLIAQLGQVRVEHIRREKNVRADELANKAMDAKAHVGMAAGDASAQDAPPAEAPADAERPALSEPGVSLKPWPPDRFTATASADSDETCPGVISAGGSWPFEGTTPPGLCVHAAAGILRAVYESKPGSAALPAQCARPGCKARFIVHFDG